MLVVLAGSGQDPLWRESARVSTRTGRPGVHLLLGGRPVRPAWTCAERAAPLASERVSSRCGRAQAERHLAGARRADQD